MSKDLVPMVTEVGDLHWVNIFGQGKLNYNEDGYDYTATVHLSGEAANKAKAKIDEVLGPIPEGKKVKSKGYRELYKDADGNLYTPSESKPASEGKPSGIFAFQFKTGVTLPDGRTKVVGVFNKDAKKINLGDRKVGNGSKGAISGKLQRYEKGKEIGVSLFLHAIQLTEFVEYSDDAGFEEQEGSFDAPVDEESGFSGQAETKPEVAKEKPRL